jgi:DNA-directed RNA polymerase subunit RPC12/RpoP
MKKQKNNKYIGITSKMMNKKTTKKYICIECKRDFSSLISFNEHECMDDKEDIEKLEEPITQ